MVVTSDPAEKPHAVTPLAADLGDARLIHVVEIIEKRSGVALPFLTRCGGHRDFGNGLLFRCGPAGGQRHQQEGGEEGEGGFHQSELLSDY